jgi:hypothetical protein
MLAYVIYELFFRFLLLQCDYFDDKSQVGANCYKEGKKYLIGEVESRLLRQGIINIESAKPLQYYCKDCKVHPVLSP